MSVIGLSIGFIIKESERERESVFVCVIQCVVQFTDRQTNISLVKV